MTLQPTILKKKKRQMFSRKKPTNPLKWQLTIYFHNGTYKNGEFKNEYTRITEPFEDTAHGPNLGFYRGVVLSFFGTGKAASFTNDRRVIKTAFVSQIHGKGAKLMEFKYRDMLRITFTRIMKYNCPDSKQVVADYYAEMERTPEASYELKSTFMYFFENIFRTVREGKLNTPHDEVMDWLTEWQDNFNEFELG